VDLVDEQFMECRASSPAHSRRHYTLPMWHHIFGELASSYWEHDSTSTCDKYSSLALLTCRCCVQAYKQQGMAKARLLLLLLLLLLLHLDVTVHE